MSEWLKKAEAGILPKKKTEGVTLAYTGITVTEYGLRLRIQKSKELKARLLY